MRISSESKAESCCTDKMNLCEEIMRGGARINRKLNAPLRLFFPFCSIDCRVSKNGFKEDYNQGWHALSKN